MGWKREALLASTSPHKHNLFNVPWQPEAWVCPHCWGSSVTRRERIWKQKEAVGSKRTESIAAGRAVVNHKAQSRQPTVLMGLQVGWPSELGPSTLAG